MEKEPPLSKDAESRLYMSDENADELYKKAIWNIKNNNYQESVNIFSKLLSMDQNNHKAWNAFGVVLNKLGNLDEAKTCFEIALRLNPENIVYNNNLKKNNKKVDVKSGNKIGKVQLKRIDTAPINKCAVKEKNISSRYSFIILFSIILILISAIYMQLGFFSNEISDITSNLEKNQQSDTPLIPTITPVEGLPAWKYSNQALELFKDGNDISALSFADKAIKLDKKSSYAAYAVKTIILFKQGKKSEAQTLFNEGISNLNSRDLFISALDNNSEQSGIELNLDGFNPDSNQQKNLPYYAFQSPKEEPPDYRTANMRLGAGIISTISLITGLSEKLILKIFGIFWISILLAFGIFFIKEKIFTSNK